MSEHIEFLIIGGGVAAARAAMSLRSNNATGRVVIVGDESDPPYDRPPLTKQYLRGSDWTHEDCHHKDTSYYPKHAIELLTGVRATRIDTTQRQVHLNNNTILTFDKLLLATGSRVRTLDVPGATMNGIYYIRTLEDVDRLKAALPEARRITCVGGGLIGAETAASLSEKGYEVTLIEIMPLIWSQFGVEAGQYFDSALAQRGITLIRPATVERIDGSNGNATHVLTREGHVVEGDLIVVGIGVVPDTTLAEAAGIAVERGVQVDQYLETNVPGIFAAGDVTRFYNPLYNAYLHCENIDNARQQGTHAGNSMLGNKEPYAVVPYAWSDLFEQDMISMEYIGYAPTWDRTVTLGEMDENKFIMLYGVDERCMAALLVNEGDKLKDLREMLKSGTSMAEAESFLSSRANGTS